MTLEDDELTVAIDGHLERVTLSAGAAIVRLWQVVRELPIGDYQMGAMHRLLGSGSTVDMEKILAGEGQTDFALDLAGGRRVIVRIWRGDGLTASQRIAARYKPEQVQESARGGVPGLWAVRDTQSGDLVRDDGGVLHFPIQDSAQGWISRQANLASYRSTRHTVRS